MTEWIGISSAPVPVRSLCHQFPMRGGHYVAQVIAPTDMTSKEADRLCAFVMALVAPPKTPLPDPPAEQKEPTHEETL